ncbi:hypothetical protein [Thiolapillus sp.]
MEQEYMATDQYQPRQFFRQVPNQYLADYFEKQGVDLKSSGEF